MIKKIISDGIGKIDNRHIEEAADYRIERKKAVWSNRQRAIAACLALFLLLGVAFGGRTIAVDAAEYLEALDFFAENELSAEDLSREEIKAVYRDITTKAFSYEKTADVLNKLSLKLYSLELSMLDRYNLEYFWENRYGYIHSYVTPESTGIWFHGFYKHFDTEPFVRMVILCYEGNKLLWDYTVNYDATLFGISVENGMVFCGERDRLYSKGYAYAFMLDYSGNVVWEYLSEDEGSQFNVAVQNGDDIAFFGSDFDENSSHNTIFYLFDDEGNKKISKKTPTESYIAYDTAIKLADKYLVKDGSKIYEVSFGGELIKEFSIKDGDMEYDIIDMKYYDGKVWFSANIDVDYYEEELEEITAIRHEYFAEWDKLGYDPGFIGERKERFTELFRSILETTLFVCDENGVIEKVHSVPGAVSRGDLEVDENGNIVLTVHRMDEAEPPLRGTSVRCIFAVVTKFRLVFDSAGKLIQTNEIETQPKRQFVY